MHSMLQPYFVLSTEKYLKAIINNYGISHFYSFTKNAATEQEIIAVPDGCIDILFTCDEHHPIAEICGSVLKPQNVLDQPTRYFGVRFYPGQCILNRNLDIKDVIGNQIGLLDIFDAGSVFETIITNTDFNVQVSTFLNFYLKTVVKNDSCLKTDELKGHLLSQILKSKGQIKVKELASDVGYSERTINTKFMNYFGISPKVLSKIVRFQNVLSELNRSNTIKNPDSLIDIAYNAGYFDQSHMYKDFNEFSKTSPGHYLEILKNNHYNDRLVVV
ncbi:helix-turn-helix domain-containing protein [Eubacteriaceae bacterium ES3]|nr:helix-turn-helix domain-containing protein [Eubacteriaceae bacterium ES3]